MSFRDLVEGYGAEKKPKKVELAEDEKRLLETKDEDLEKLSARVKLRIAYLKALVERQEQDKEE